MTDKADVSYETRSVKSVRGMEARTRAKLATEGWEFVSQVQGTLLSELLFRRPKPKAPWKFIAIGGGAFAVVISAVIVINVIAGQGGASEIAEMALPPTQAQIAPTETPAPTVDSTVTDITVDELLDKLNSANMGGVAVGDRFRVTGDLFMSDLWMTGASGDYVVMLKAKDGAQDLSVFVDEADAAAWQDGTRVEMVIEIVEATINGETTDGWLRAESTQVIQ